jgi:hypothetical protein
MIWDGLIVTYFPVNLSAKTMVSTPVPIRTLDNAGFGVAVKGLTRIKTLREIGQGSDLNFPLDAPGSEDTPDVNQIIPFIKQ